MIKEPIYQEDISTLNVYASNTRVQNKWNTLIKLKGKIDKSTIIVGNSNTSFSIIDVASIYNIYTNIEEEKKYVEEKRPTVLANLT